MSRFQPEIENVSYKKAKRKLIAEKEERMVIKQNGADLIWSGLVWSG